jgi:hypothetical protein
MPPSIRHFTMILPAQENQKSMAVRRNKMRNIVIWTIVGIVVAIGIVNLGYLFPRVYTRVQADVENAIATHFQAEPVDKGLYDAKLLALANNKISASTSSSTWPVKAAYPNGGAILPFKRVVAYYGNFYSKGMGVLGQYPVPEMLSRLDAEVKKWEAADPSTPVVPAIDYIAVTAQASAGADGKYRARMPASQIDIALKLADQIHGLVFLEVQAGLSTFPIEVPLLEKYLKMPQVHLSLDPEFYMHGGSKPGTVIGSVTATDVNTVAQYLAKLVRDNNLPPKILVVHRFTQPMVRQATSIKPLPEVQIVMDMDGWGTKERKIDSYQAYIYKEPVQFTGFKLFYKNDIKVKGTTLMTPAEVLKLAPKPIFIQYQ